MKAVTHIIQFHPIGDRYQLFGDDARKLNVTCGVPLRRGPRGDVTAAVPREAIEGYLRRMIVAGHRVALCELGGGA